MHIPHKTLKPYITTLQNIKSEQITHSYLHQPHPHVLKVLFFSLLG